MNELKVHLGWYEKTACGLRWVIFHTKTNVARIVLDVVDDKKFVTCRRCLKHEYLF